MPTLKISYSTILTHFSTMTHFIHSCITLVGTLPSHFSRKRRPKSEYAFLHFLFILSYRIAPFDVNMQSKLMTKEIPLILLSIFLFLKHFARVCSSIHIHNFECSVSHERWLSQSTTETFQQQRIRLTEILLYPL